MSAGKHISLEEVRRNPRLLGRFIRERVAGGHGETDENRFEGTLTSMLRMTGSAVETSSLASGEGCSEIQTRQDISPDTSAKREHESRE